MDEAEALVFVSYAHADDEPFEPDTDGWVTRFVANLEKSVHMQRGGQRVSLWMDHRLEPQRHLDAELRRRIADSRVFLAFLSPSYLESTWCAQEMDTFVRLVGQGSGADRVFLIEVRPTDRTDWHAGVRDLASRPFWRRRLNAPVAMPLGFPVPNARADADYWEQINFLADALVRQIDLLPSNPPTAVAPEVERVADAAPVAVVGGDAELHIVINADAVDADLGRQAQSVFGALDVYATLAPAPLLADLPEAINRAQYLTPRLQAVDLQRAINGPALVFGGSVDAGFAAACVDLITGNPDQLPLLQHALARWWRVAEAAAPDAPHICAAVTEKVGDVSTALDRHAEALYADLSLEARAATEAMFRALTEGREGGVAVRRPQRLQAISAWTGFSVDALKPLIEISAASLI